MDRQYVGIDLHRRRCVIVRKSAAGEKLSSVRVANDALGIASAVAEAGPNPEVVIEATYGWYWVVDLLQEQGATVHLANPSGLNWGTRRVKNDERDAVDLIDMLRLGRLPEAWIAPPATRELRELVRYRAKLVALRSGLKAQVHAVMAKEGVLPAVTDMFCQAGNAQLDTLELADAYATRVQSLRTLIDAYDHEVARLEAQIRSRLRGHRGYRAIQAINGIGPTMAAILVAEIGDVTRFRSAPALCSWAGTHAEAQRVGHDGAARCCHQARFAAGALGSDRRHRPLPRWRKTGRRLPPDRGTARQEQSDHGDRSQGPHPHLLRLARRRDPMPRARCMNRSNTTGRALAIGMTPATRGEID